MILSCEQASIMRELMYKIILVRLLIIKKFILFILRLSDVEVVCLINVKQSLRKLIGLRK